MRSLRMRRMMRSRRGDLERGASARRVVVARTVTARTTVGVAFVSIAAACLWICAPAARAAGDGSDPRASAALSADDALRPRQWRLGDDVLVTELAPGVWRHTSWSTHDGTRVPANGLVLRDGDDIVLVDTAWGEEPTAVLLDWIEHALGKPVSRVVATHSHEDRVGAPSTLAARGIPLLVHPETAPLAAHRGVTTTQPLTGFAGTDAVTLGGIEIFHPGAAHAPDNVVVWIPRGRILFGGCAVKSADATELGFVGDADLGHWPDAIRAIRRRYPGASIVVPGHGEPGDAALIAHTLELLAARGPVAVSSSGMPAPATPSTTEGVAR